MQDRPYPPSDEASAPLEEERERDAADAEALEAPDSNLETEAEPDTDSDEGDVLSDLTELSAEALAPEEKPPPEAPPDAELIPEPDVELEPAVLLAEVEPTEPPDIDPALLDPDALKVVHRLRSFGHEAYFVGGCVRDLLVGGKPKDFDIATSAHPGEVRAVFRNCRLIGRRFRLAHVYFKGGKIIEVATFRANPTDLVEPPGENAEPAENGEGGGEDLLISDDNVFGTAEEDARRRDFTINGLFYDVGTGKVIDYVRGRRDLERRDIRTIGDPEIRMREDPVRLLRAVRFACRLGFDIESRTYAAMEGAVEELPRCAAPRLLEDTFRIIRGGISRPGIHLLYALDALKFLLPPIDAFLKEGGKEAETRFAAHADALDRKVASGAQLEDAVLLAALLLPIAESAPADESTESRPQVAKPIEDLLSELVQSARLPRRIAERCRMILFAQKTLSGERRRRGSLQSFRRHPLFNEALTVFELSVAATGEHQEALEAWQSGTAPQPAAGAEGAPAGGKRRRRRRRRRGGGDEGGAEESAPPAAAESTEG